MEAVENTVNLDRIPEECSHCHAGAGWSVKGWGKSRISVPCDDCRVKYEASQARDLKLSYELEDRTEKARLLKAAEIPQAFFEVPDEWVPKEARAALGGGQQILFTGPVGTGKTAAACRLLKLAVTEYRVGGLFLPSKRFILAIQSTYGAAAKETTETVVNRFARASCLVLDDLGKERPTADSLSWLELVVDERWSNRRTTIITTNLKLPELAGVYGERIADRIASGVVVATSGSSRRGRHA